MKTYGEMTKHAKQTGNLFILMQVAPAEWFLWRQELLTNVMYNKRTNCNQHHSILLRPFHMMHSQIRVEDDKRTTIQHTQNELFFHHRGSLELLRNGKKTTNATKAKARQRSRQATYCNLRLHEIHNGIN